MKRCFVSFITTHLNNIRKTNNNKKNKQPNSKMGKTSVHQQMNGYTKCDTHIQQNIIQL